MGAAAMNHWPQLMCTWAVFSIRAAASKLGARAVRNRVLVTQVDEIATHIR